ncbi:(Fe-S)-binding protein [Solicola gregarius]|uniref:(Fe-S)-binding protein n=1 Tax=Solicola gregarius TaxID=2908642 RepID=A0AA46TL17_9ACTN|nr:(Fe-S)-binding protein [Solicola gregarius]UYM07083.1 (Fe-S)-binding protein [Solicola gregarius]
MQIVAIVVSLAITVVTVPVLVLAIRQLLGVVRMGQPAVGRTDNPGARTLTMLKETVGHTRMLQWTWIGIMHWFVFAAFIFLSTAVGGAYFQLFDVDFQWPIVGHWYPFEWFSEFIGLLGTIGIVVLVIYRQVKHPRRLERGSRFFGSTFWQAYFVELFVLLESSAILFIRGAEYNLGVAEGHDNATRAHFPLSSYVGDLYPSSVSANENLVYTIAMLKIVLAMIWLLVIARNLTMGVAWHRFTAWFNIWFKRESDGSSALGGLQPIIVDGKPLDFENIEELDEDAALGVGKAEDFTWKGILDFTTCTECGRCQSQCPAWNTEKPLSPKLLMMGLRDHAYAKSTGDEGAAERSLVGKADEDSWFYNPEGGDFVIDEDVLWSCTSCGACVQQCPVDIEHVDHIVDMRRYQVLVESNFPTELNQLFKGLENKGNPWNMSPNARMDWAKDLDFEVKQVGSDVEDLSEVEWLFWVGCAGAYEDRAKKTTRAVAELLHLADVDFAVLGDGETCTGDPARRSGNEFVYSMLAMQNAEVFKETKAKKVVATCAHCFNTLKNEYAEFGVELEVVHHTQLLNRLVREGKLTPVAPSGNGAVAGKTITYHDPCYLGRHNQVYEPPRELLNVLPNTTFNEMPRNSERSFCCGAGGARMWMEESIGQRINVNRTEEAIATGADQIAVGCPFCRVMLSDGLTLKQSEGEASEEVEVLDVAQMLLASVKRGDEPGPSPAE